MKKSACIETLFTEAPFGDRFRAAKDAGFDLVEFWSWTDKDLTKIAQACGRAGIRVASMSGDRDFSLVDPAHRKPYVDFLRKSVDAAKAVGCPVLVIHSNALGEGGKVVDRCAGLSHTVKLCAMFDTLREIAPIAEKAGVTLALEALNTKIDHVGNFLETTAMGAEMTRLIASKNLKILYDAYHMQLNEGDLCGTLSEYIDQIAYIHVADVPGRHEPGTGEIDYANVFRHLERLGYSGVTGFELFPKNGTAEAVEAIMRTASEGVLR